jgi:hypothetical protein
MTVKERASSFTAFRATSWLGTSSGRAVSTTIFHSPEKSRGRLKSEGSWCGSLEAGNHHPQHGGPLDRGFPVHSHGEA